MLEVFKQELLNKKRSQSKQIKYNLHRLKGTCGLLGFFKLYYNIEYLESQLFEQKINFNIDHYDEMSQRVDYINDMFSNLIDKYMALDL